MRRATIAGLLMLAVARPAAAKSCIRHAYETLDLQLEGVYEGDRRVGAPAALAGLDRMLNSGNEGKSVLVWNRATMAHAKFYRLTQPLEAAPAVAEYLKASAGRRLDTACGYSVGYTPVLPGRYAFDQEHSDGSTTPRDLAEPEVIVAPGRDVVEVRARIGERRLRAVYRVTCARFTWDKSETTACAPTEQTHDLAAALASAEGAADKPSAGVEAPAEPAAPMNVEPRGIERPPPPVSTGGRCSVDGSAPWPALLLLLALRARTRARRGGRAACAGAIRTREPDR